MKLRVGAESGLGPSGVSVLAILPLAVGWLAARRPRRASLATLPFVGLVAIPIVVWAAVTQTF